MKCPFCGKGMKPRKFDGHTSAACVNKKCPAYYRAEYLSARRVRKAFRASSPDGVRA